MTEKAKRNSRPITKGVAVDRIFEIHATNEERIAAAKAEIIAADSAQMMALFRRVPEADRAATRAMLRAVGIELPIDAEFVDPGVDDIPDAPDETPSRPTLEEYDARGVMEPLPQERLAVGRKR